MAYILIGILLMFGVVGHDEVLLIHLPIVLIAIGLCIKGINDMELK